MTDSGVERDPKTRVELILSAKNIADKDLLSKSDPICVVYHLVAQGTYGHHSGGTQWVEVARTEQINNCLSPQWHSKPQLDYHFEAKQPLAFELYDIDSGSAALSEHDFLGRAECELADVVAAPDGALTLPIMLKSRQRGTLTVRAEELDDGQKEVLYFVVHGRGLDKKDFFGKSDPFLEFYRVGPTGQRQTMVHRTEVIKRTLNPEWRPFEITVRHLCEGEKEREFEILCYDYDNDGGHDFIGSCRTSVNGLTMRRAQNANLPLINEKKRAKKGAKYRDSGVLHFLQADLRREFTFLDFIAGGMQLDFAVSVDFTSSNGPIHSSSSLHFISGHYPNQYEMAIRSVLEICEHYNRSRVFEALGFGAKIPPSFGVSHLFPLNLLSLDRCVVGVDGVLDAYRLALANTQLYGPTNFSPTIVEYARKARQFPPDGSRYQILLIITDGIITDMQKTIGAIIDASSLPLSIIIIGVGGEDFEKMDQLDSDTGLLTLGERVAKRDIVQFVPFRNFLGGLSTATDPARLEQVKAALAKEVLAEVPAQVTSYMKSKSIVPLPPPTMQMPQGRDFQIPSGTYPSPYPPSGPAPMPPSGQFEPPPSYQQATLPLGSYHSPPTAPANKSQMDALASGINQIGV